MNNKYNCMIQLHAHGGVANTFKELHQHHKKTAWQPIATQDNSNSPIRRWDARTNNNNNNKTMFQYKKGAWWWWVTWVFNTFNASMYTQLHIKYSLVLSHNVGKYSPAHATHMVSSLQRANLSLMVMKGMGKPNTLNLVKVLHFLTPESKQFTWDN